VGRSAVLLPLIAAFIAGVPLSASAQERRSVIRGTVVTANDLTPIAGVNVALVGAGRTVRTDKAGVFVFDSLQAGTYLVQVRGVGDETPMTPVPLGKREIIDLEVKLGIPNAQMLPELVTDAPAPEGLSNEIEATRLPAEFLARQRTGIGVFVTRDQIQQRRPPTVADIFRAMRGVTVSCRGGVCLPRPSRSANNCGPVVVVDGAATDVGVLSSMVPNDLEAIEFYSGMSTVPAEYLQPGDRPACGMILVWTRVPPQAKKRKS
jgi:hypothetical protein